MEIKSFIPHRASWMVVVMTRVFLYHFLKIFRTDWPGASRRRLLLRSCLARLVFFSGPFHLDFRASVVHLGLSRGEVSSRRRRSSIGPS